MNLHEIIKRISPANLPAVASLACVDVETLTNAIENESADAFREHSVALNVINHILQRKDGAVPIEPFPVGANSDHVINRADMAIQGLDAAANALGKMSKVPKPVVRRVAIYGYTDNAAILRVRALEHALLDAGVPEVNVQLSECMAQARIAAQDVLDKAGGGALLGVGPDGHVIDRDRVVSLKDWLERVEVAR